jgi:hypothetical protein
MQNSIPEETLESEKAVSASGLMSCFLGIEVENG